MKMKKSIPAFPVQHIEESIAFYQNKLGFSVLHYDEGFAILMRDEVEVHLWAASDEAWKNRNNLSELPVYSGAESFLAGMVSCRIQVQGIDELFQEYKSQGVIYSPDTVVKEMPWGHREFPTLDHHRNLLTFYEVI